MKLRYRRLRLELGFTWAIARNSSDYKDNFIIELSEDGLSGWGEAAPNIRYGEIPDAIEAYLVELRHQERSLPEWVSFLATTQLPNCLAMGLDLALRQYEAALAGESLAWRLGEENLQPLYPVSFTLPIMEAEAVGSFFETHSLARFSFLKVKVGKQSHDEVLTELGRLYTGPVVIDGNEAFTSLEELDRHMERWQRHVLVAALEQPFAAENRDLARQSKGRYPVPLLADEAVVHGADIAALAEGYDGINIKLQKTGSYAEAFRQKTEAKRLGLRLMIGCMVETSVGIWHGLHLAAGADFIDLDSMLYLKSEPYGWVKEEAGHLKPASDPRLDL